MEKVKVAIAGAGLIGRRHADYLARAASARLVAIADPDPASREIAKAHGAAHFTAVDAALDGGGVDGLIVATPTPDHMSSCLAAVSRGIPVLVEKPITADVAQAEKLVHAASVAEVPLLVGHHRRHNPIAKAARAAITRGEIGDLVAINAMVWLGKPDDYFAPDWRRAPGAGPVMTNLIHDIDLIRYLCGDVVAVQAVTSNAQRGFAVEDTGAVLLTFASGALGTMTVSDAAPSPWSWELSTGENPAYPHVGQTCYQIGGRMGALELPSLRIWQHENDGGWWTPMSARTLAVIPADPLAAQIEHFSAVIRGKATPAVTGEDGLAALHIAEAIFRSAKTGASVSIS